MPQFKVLQGEHRDYSDDGSDSNFRYKRGDVVTTDKDLTKFNAPGAVKFALIPGTEGILPSRLLPKGPGNPYVPIPVAESAGTPPNGPKRGK